MLSCSFPLVNLSSYTNSVRSKGGIQKWAFYLIISSWEASYQLFVWELGKPQGIIPTVVYHVKIAKKITSFFYNPFVKGLWDMTLVYWKRQLMFHVQQMRSSWCVLQGSEEAKRLRFWKNQQFNYDWCIWVETKAHIFGDYYLTNSSIWHEAKIVSLWWKALG